MILFGKRENTFSSISIICNLVTLFRVNYYNHPINMKNYTLNISILFLSLFLTSCMQPIKKLGLSYGAFLRPGGIEFRIYAPSSDTVKLVIFEKVDDESGNEYPMEKLENGDWTYFLKNAPLGTLYGYRLTGPWNDDNVIVADPYSKAAVTQNSWRHVAKSLVVDNAFDWENDTWQPTHVQDLIIYEAHVRDLTQHESSGAKSKGSYLGLIERGQKGGVEHLKSMGVNAVQFLPLWDFANVEIPYKKKADGMYNDWNPYERNHWGYMPTFFMAPESYYASDWTDERGQWNGKDGRAVIEMKEMVKSLHKEGMAVILDVVINHVSNYDWHPLKYIDRSVYFKLDENDNYISQCCGNLLETDHEKVQQYVIESLKYWMTEYHIDGFRFDQCFLLSSKTATLIINELKSINPDVIIYGEAWSDREVEFSKIGWGSFNGKFRDVLRGDLHNTDIKGFLFGQYRNGESLEDLKTIIMGSSYGKNKIYQSTSHSINFLEVHDDYCFSDYLRFSTGKNSKDDIINDQMEHIALTPEIFNINKLAAVILLTSQGVPLIHQGQEWAHTQIIAETDAPDTDIGKMDRNPYNKDNETNWVNWIEKEQNSKLVDYYQGLISIRKALPELRHARINDFKFQGLSETALGYVIKNSVAVYLNGSKAEPVSTELPEGEWKLLANKEQVNPDGIQTMSGMITIPRTSGMVLQKIN